MTAPRPFAEVVEELQRRMRLVEERCYPRDVDLLRIAAVDALPALLARAAVFEAAVALIAAEDMPPHTPFDGNSVEWDEKFDAEHFARKRLRELVALAAENQPRAERGEEAT